MFVTLMFAGMIAVSPQGMQVVSGKAHAVSEERIETRGRTILEWESFSLGEANNLHFAQSGERPAVLNRVTGSSSSFLEGRLTSNGEVFLLNPNGILIGKTGQIHTAGFIASTLDLLDHEFLAGETFRFTGNHAAKVENQGIIDCPEGVVFLAGGSVENGGFIRGAKVYVTAADEVWLQPAGMKHQFFKGVAGPNQKRIDQSGAIEATALRKTDQGEIYLFADAGICEVKGSMSSANGGKIYVLGGDLRLFDEAKLNASGPLGGGEILIGGDYRGDNLLIPNAQRVWVAKESVVYADALLDGNGGKVIYWGNESMVYYGHTSAKGGMNSGDGGFVEISAASNQLIFEGTSTTLSPYGKAGWLYLDPCAVTISTSATTVGVVNTAGVYTFPGLSSANIQNTAIQTALGSNNVTIDATASGTGGAGTGSITIASGTTISWGSTLLTLIADSGGITMTDGTCSLTSPSNGILQMTADGNINLAGTITMAGTGSINVISNSGAISVANGSSLTTTGVGAGGGLALTALGGSVTVGSSATISTAAAQALRLIAFPGDISIGAGTTIQASGDGLIELQAVSGTVSFTASSGTVTTGGSGSLTLNGGVGVTLQAGTSITATGGGSISFITGGTIAFAGTGASAMTVSTVSSGTISIQRTSTAFTVPGVQLSTGSNLQISSVNGDITISATLTGTSGGSRAIELAPTGAGTSLIRCTGTGNIILTGSSADTSGSAQGILLGSTSGGGVCRLSTNSGNITMTGTLSGSGSITGSGGALQLNAAGCLASTSGSVTLSGTGQGSGSGGSNNHGLRIDANPFSAAIAGTVAMTGVGGGGSTSYGVYLLGAVTTAGPLTINGTAGAGANSYGLYLGGTLTTAGGAITVGNTLTTTTALAANLSIDSTNSGGSSGANIALNGAISNVSGNRTLTLRSGASGSITLGSSVGTTSSRMSLTLTSCNALSCGGSIYLNSTSFNPPAATVVTLANSITIDTVSGAITFPAALLGTSANAQDLTLTTTGSLTLNGNVGTALVPLGSFSMTGGASGLSLGASDTDFYSTSFVVGGTIPTTLNNTALLTINTTGALSFGGTVNGAHPLTLLSTGGALTLGAAVGNSTPLTSLTATGSTLSLGGNISTSGNISITAATTMTADSTMTSSGGLINLNTSTVTGGYALSLVAAGTVTANGAIGATALTSFSASGSGISLGGGSIVAGSGGATFTGPVTLTSQNLAITTSSGGGNITFSSTINGARSLTLNAGAGSVSYGGSIGGATPVLSFSSTAATTQLSANITTVSSGSIAVAGNVSLTSGIALNTGSGVGSVTFSSGNITGAQALSITTGAASFGGAVGTPAALTSLVVTAPSIGVNGTHTVSSGPMTYTGAVTLNGTQSFIDSGATGITFGSSITGNYGLTIQAPSSSILVTGAVNTAGSTGGSVTASASGAITFSSSINAQTGGEVSITSTGGAVTVGSITNQ